MSVIVVTELPGTRVRRVDLEARAALLYHFLIVQTRFRQVDVSAATSTPCTPSRAGLLAPVPPLTSDDSPRTGDIVLCMKGTSIDSPRGPCEPETPAPDALHLRCPASCFSVRR